MSDRVLKNFRYYMIIFCLVIMFLVNMNHINITYTILGFSYMITFFMRSYKSTKNVPFVFIGLIITEIIIVLGMSYLTDVSHVLLLSLTLSDGIIYLKGRAFYSFLPLWPLALVLHSFMVYQKANLVSMIGIPVFATFGALLIRSLRSERRSVTDLYDQVREKEEALLKANMELALLNQTTEELTLLKERTRVSRDIHDTVGHQLSALHIQLNAIHSLIDKKPETAKDMLALNIDYSKGILQTVRDTVHNLSPSIDDSTELILIIEQMTAEFEKMTGTKVKFITSKERWSIPSSHELLSVIKESFSNALRHGKASEIVLSMIYYPDYLHLHIKDNGMGCPSLQKGFGLGQMEKRISHLQGSMTIESQQGQGVSITINIPKTSEV